RLGLRTNVPRVYVVTGLGGGTGGGMFIDLAYVLRALLKEHGFARPDLVGLLQLPVAEGNETSSPQELGNAFAALTELHHFGAAPPTSRACFAPQKPPTRAPAPPFVRCFLIQAPAEPAATSLHGGGLLGGQVLRDLTTNLGRVADERRAALPRVAPHFST